MFCGGFFCAAKNAWRKRREKKEEAVFILNNSASTYSLHSGGGVGVQNVQDIFLNFDCERKFIFNKIHFRQISINS